MPYIRHMYYEFIELAPFAAIRLVAAYGKNGRDDVPRQWLRKLKERYDQQDQ